MPRVVPSQVVAFVDQVFSWAKDQPEDQGVKLTIDNSHEVAGLLELVDQVPGELLTLDGSEHSNFVCCVVAIRNQVSRWNSRGDSGFIKYVRGLPKLNPVALIRRALAGCPDESPVPANAELLFIEEFAFRVGLRNDMGATNRALVNGEWKAATVLAGSVVEALLLWSLAKRERLDVSRVAGELVAAKTLKRPPQEPLEKWDLNDYIEVALRLEIVTPNTATQVRLAKDYRNLIHPGRVQRLGQECDRGTALAAAAAVEDVVRDLNRSSRE